MGDSGQGCVSRGNGTCPAGWKTANGSGRCSGGDVICWTGAAGQDHDPLRMSVCQGTLPANLGAVRPGSFGPLRLPEDFDLGAALAQEVCLQHKPECGQPQTCLWLMEQLPEETGLIANSVPCQVAGCPGAPPGSCRQPKGGAPSQPCHFWAKDDPRAPMWGCGAEGGEVRCRFGHGSDTLADCELGCPARPDDDAPYWGCDPAGGCSWGTGDAPRARCNDSCPAPKPVEDWACNYTTGACERGGGTFSQADCQEQCIPADTGSHVWGCSAQGRCVPGAGTATLEECRAGCPPPGLDGGAIAGIVIGAVIGAALLAAAAAALVRRHRRPRAP